MKLNKIVRITSLILLGVVLEIINYLFAVKYENYFETGLSLAGAFILFVSLFGNIGLQYYLDMKEEQQRRKNHETK